MIRLGSLRSLGSEAVSIERCVSVETAQRAISSFGGTAALTVDGVLGTRTRAALDAFSSDHNVTWEQRAGGGICFSGRSDYVLAAYARIQSRASSNERNVEMTFNAESIERARTADTAKAADRAISTSSTVDVAAAAPSEGFIASIGGWSTVALAAAGIAAIGALVYYGGKKGKRRRRG